jgi:hypothetical protein
MDLTTKAGVLRFCEMRREEMARCFERIGRFEVEGMAFCAYVFATRDIDRRDVLRGGTGTGKKLPAPKAHRAVMPAFAAAAIDARNHTEAFGMVVRKLCKLTRATGTVLMSEMWVGHISAPKDTTWEEARAARPASLEDWDDRREGLYMHLEHSATGVRVWFNEILTEGGVRRLKGWEEPYREEAAGWEGRLVDLASWRA